MRICALLVAFLPFVGCMYYPLLVAFSPLFLSPNPYPARILPNIVSQFFLDNL
jgi:hypothetical protein